MAKKAPPVLIGPITAAVSVIGLMIGIWALLQSYKSDTGAQIASIESHFDSRISALEQRMSGLETAMENIEFKLGELTGLIQAYRGAASSDGVARRSANGAASAPLATSPVTPTRAAQDDISGSMPMLALEDGSTRP